MNKAILTIKRIDYRTPNSKIIIECNEAIIELWPDKLQTYDITDLLHGGKPEMQIPCETNLEIKPD